MKRIKKLASLLLAMIMIFTMSATAFAAQDDDLENPGPTTETEGENSSVGDTQNTSSKPTIKSGQYNIYQVFTGEYDTTEKLLYNIMWGKNGTGETGTRVADGILKDLESVNNESLSDTEQLAIINKYADLNSDPYIESGTETRYTGLPAGYYLVEGTVTFSNETTAATLYVVQVVGDGVLAFEPKVSVPTVDKKIVEGTDRVETNEASFYEEVNYEITGTMPSNIDSYKTYYYLFTDTLSKGLTYKADSIKVTVNGVDVTKYFYKNVSEYDKVDGTTIEVGIEDVKALSLLTDPAVGAIEAGTEVILTYTATLNEDAVIAGDGNPNDVKLQYSNNPNNSGDGSTTPPPEEPEKPEPVYPTGETPESRVVTYTTQLTITKHDEKGEILTGVEFTLTGYSSEVTETTREAYVEAEDGTYYLLTDGTYTETPPTIADDETDNSDKYASTTTMYKKVTLNDVEEGAATRVETTVAVDANGQATFKGLGAGTYTITETKTPSGYNTIEPITFTVSFDKTTKTFASSNTDISVNVTNMLETTIINQKGSLLPSTGGIGTTIFYVVGAILVLGAGILLVTKKRMSAR